VIEPGGIIKMNRLSGLVNGSAFRDEISQVFGDASKQFRELFAPKGLAKGAVDVEMPGRGERKISTWQRIWPLSREFDPWKVLTREPTWSGSPVSVPKVVPKYLATQKVAPALSKMAGVYDQPEDEEVDNY
jgi:hypothetical protein